MVKIKIKQVHSTIKCPKTQKRTIEALGFHRLNQVVEHEDNACLRGMIEKVKHLVTIVE